MTSLVEQVRRGMHTRAKWKFNNKGKIIKLKSTHLVSGYTEHNPLLLHWKNHFCWFYG